MTTALPRVMFVDDDVNLLRSLERALRSRRLVWDMAFIESAEAALAACAESRFDAVVTDIGVELFTDFVPSAPDEIERIMKEPGILQFRPPVPEGNR